MPETANPSGAGYWYGQSPETAGGVDVLNALRAYRAAEAAMRRRTRDSMRMNETDLLAIRYVMQARQAGSSIGPKDLSRILNISTASRRSLVRVSVPVWGFTLSGPLKIVDLVSRYLTNYLILRMPILLR